MDYSRVEETESAFHSKLHVICIPRYGNIQTYLQEGQCYSISSDAFAVNGICFRQLVYYYYLCPSRSLGRKGRLNDLRYILPNYQTNLVIGLQELSLLAIMSPHLLLLNRFMFYPTYLCRSDRSLSFSRNAMPVCKIRCTKHRIREFRDIHLQSLEESRSPDAAKNWFRSVHSWKAICLHFLSI